MIFDDLGLPRDTGATDFQDSARLAGLMTLFGWEGPLWQYMDLDGTMVRHPMEGNVTKFSRDQMVCLIAGLWFDWIHSPKVNQQRTASAPLHADKWSKWKRAPNGDLFSPSVRGHIRRCANQKATWFQDLWLKFDILWSAYAQPEAEPNQLICMLIVAGPEYVKMWTHHNKKWKDAINIYWCGWRQEQELAAWMVHNIEIISLQST